MTTADKVISIVGRRHEDRAREIWEGKLVKVRRAMENLNLYHQRVMLEIVRLEQQFKPGDWIWMDAVRETYDYDDDWNKINQEKIVKRRYFLVLTYDQGSELGWRGSASALGPEEYDPEWRKRWTRYTVRELVGFKMETKANGSLGRVKDTWFPHREPPALVTDKDVLARLRMVERRERKKGHAVR